MKAALVTGAAKRIGAAIATRLAGEGWHVVLHFATSATEATALQASIERSGHRASLLTADLADAAACLDLIDRAFALAPGLSLLVNNASRFAYDDAATATPEALQGNFAVNTMAPILLSQRFAARLPAGATGTIVNLLDNRISAPNPDYFAYGISKYALLGATRMMALALAPRVRVNGIAPGITLESGQQGAANFAATHDLNPLRRGCTPDEIAGAVSFIAATPAMTGAILTIDGGLSLANPGRDVAFLERNPTR